jgi:nitrogen fixation protein FixH
MCSVLGNGEDEGEYSLKITHEPWDSPDREAPALNVDARPQFSKARTFALSASVSDDRAPKSVSYRVKPPGSAQFLGWREVALGGSGRSAKWSAPLELTKEGRWEVEVQARDAAGNNSKTGTIVVIADRTKPTAKITSAASVRSASYRLKANVADRAQLATVRYRLKKPRATKFGDWTIVNLRGNKLKQEWSRLLTLRKTGPWQIELQAVDAAGNASKTAAIKVNRTK